MGRGRRKGDKQTHVGIAQTAAAGGQIVAAARPGPVGLARAEIQPGRDAVFQIQVRFAEIDQVGKVRVAIIGAIEIAGQPHREQAVGRQQSGHGPVQPRRPLLVAQGHAGLDGLDAGEHHTHRQQDHTSDPGQAHVCAPSDVSSPADSSVASSVDSSVGAPADGSSSDSVSSADCAWSFFISSM